MKYRLIINSGAESDIVEAFKWYESQQEGLGIKLIDEIDKKLNLIEQSPFICQIRYRNIRFALLNRFPYAIHYRVQERNIYVKAVLNTAQDSSNFKG